MAAKPIIPSPAPALRHLTTKLTCRGRLQMRGVTENQYGGPGQVQGLPLSLLY
jgi:hypothetical protein